MTREELIKELHTYSKAEEYLKSHPKVRFDSSLHKGFNSQLTPSESNNMLVSLIPSINNKTPYLFPNTYFFKSEDSVKIKITQHTRYSTPVMHTHNFFEMFYVLEGEFDQIINNQKITMKTGDICLIQPGVYHSLDVHNYSVVLNILIEADTFRKLTINNPIVKDDFSKFFEIEMFSKTFNNYLIFRTVGDSVVQNQILDIDLELINKAKNYAEMAPLHLMFLLTHLLRYYSDSVIKPKRPTKDNSLNFQLLNEIERNYKTITLDSLASDYNYSPQYVSKCIKEASGLSFKQYLKHKRLSVGVDLLRESNNSIREISESVGYSNVENFIRLIKNEFHQTPLQFRKESLKLHK